MIGAQDGIRGSVNTVDVEIYEFSDDNARENAIKMINNMAEDFLPEGEAFEGKIFSLTLY
jgi:hypothetical protein